MSVECLLAPVCPVSTIVLQVLSIFPAHPPGSHFLRSYDKIVTASNGDKAPTPSEGIRYKEALAIFSPRLVVSEAALALIYQGFIPHSATQSSMVLQLATPCFSVWKPRTLQCRGCDLPATLPSSVPLVMALNFSDQSRSFGLLSSARTSRIRRCNLSRWAAMLLDQRFFEGHSGAGGMECRPMFRMCRRSARPKVDPSRRR
jgi:hypothetical protein